MISIAEALQILNKIVKPTFTQILPIESSIGYVCAQDRFAEFDLPRFDNSAMDGYAVTMADAGAEIVVREVVFAGDESEKKVRFGHGVKIMTGAKIPDGADAVIPKENTVLNKDKVLLPKSIKRGSNIRKRGEDILKNEPILKEGEEINGYAIAQLASQGVTHIRVYRKPRVSIFATGHELRMHYESIEANRIYNSNAPTFVARSKELGCEANFIGSSEDTLESIKSQIIASLDSDLIITSGGVSVGDADFTKDAFKELGMKTIFEKVDIKPGKPTIVGKIGKTWILNLPGNPTAAAINFELFARTIIDRLRGSKNSFISPVFTQCAEDISLKPGKYTALLGKFEGDSFKALKKQGPGMISPLKEADGFIIVEPKTSFIKAGSTVKVISIRFKIGKEKQTDIFTYGKSYSFEM